MFTPFPRSRTMRANYRELPRYFAVMSSLPPPSLRFFILETSEPQLYGNNETLQEVYTNLHPSSDNRFTIVQEHRFHPDKYRMNVVLNMPSGNPRAFHLIHWWFTGFTLQNMGYNREYNDIPVIDMDSRLIQDLLFEQGRHITLTPNRNTEDIYRIMMTRRFDILAMYPNINERYNDDNYPSARRRLSFSLRDLERPMTPPRNRYDDYDDRGQFRFTPRNMIPPSPRQLANYHRPPSRNVIVQPRPSEASPFSLPKFVQEAILDSHRKNDKACSITMIPFKDIQEISITSCYHCFEKEALSRWMTDNQSCPECRTAVNGVVHLTQEAGPSV